MDVKYFKKLKIPDKSGVYIFKKKNEILYVGKATSLKDRVKSYFGKDLIESRGPILVDLIFKADKIDWQETDSVLEALILEAVLIKKYQPKYNTKEKSDKSFNYVCITKPARNALHSDAGGEKLPRVIIKRGKEILQGQNNFRNCALGDKRTGDPHVSKNHSVPFANTFGPYPNGGQLREALKIVRRIFPFLDEKSKNYLEFYRQINLVPDLNDQKMYLQNIKNIKLFFSGKKQQIFRNLRKEMKEYAKKREFEKAGEIKRQLFALKHINDVALIKNSGNSILKQNVLERTLGRSDGDGQRKFSTENFRGESENSLRRDRIEAYDIAHMSGENMVGVMVVLENGEIEKNEYRKFKIKTQTDANDTGALKEVLERRFAHPEWRYPKLIVVDGGIAQINTAKAILMKIGLKIGVVSVLKDEHHRPKKIMGNKEFVQKYEREILLANSEAHRFAIIYHKKMRSKNFLK
ncbi:MAG: GIY-YIG nuclease family protein [Candidatus Paceibacterota bacterium]